MKIVHVETGRHLYGGARQVRYLIDGLARLGVGNVLLCPKGAAIAREDLPAEIVELRLGGDLDTGSVRRMRDAFAARRADLVHVHSRRGADVFAGLAASAGRWPAVLTRRVDADEWAPWARLKYSRYAALIAISSAIERQLVAGVGLSPKRVFLVPSGVDTGTFAPSSDARGRLVDALGLRGDAVLIGVVAQLISRKGHTTLLDAVARLPGSGDGVELLLFGRGPLAQRIERDAAARNLSARVRLVGFRDDLDRLLPGLDVVAHPASREGLGLAVLEAMSAGVPVAVSAAGGLTDVVEDGVSGLLVPPDDAAAWSDALLRLIEDPALRRRLGAAGRARIEQSFSVEQMLVGNVDVYRAVLGDALPLQSRHG
ncbi:MAG: glycosyltransferase family 4 protein [Gammaproteobacteria bacterium]|nr:glycosyltransferase family 4 protein [Gammaproteobacteria bacterium]